MKYKPYALAMSEGQGVFTLHCLTKELALPLIKEVFAEEYEDNWDEEDRPVITIEDIEEKKMFECRKCSFYTIGESICIECGRGLNQKGRKTFVYEF